MFVWWIFLCNKPSCRNCACTNFYMTANVQRADRRADKYITVFPYLCRKKEGLTAGGQPIAPSRLRVYAPL